MLQLDIKKWDYTMGGNEFEAVMSIVRDRAGTMYSKICNLLRSGGPDLRKDEDFLALDRLDDRIFEEKDKTMDYWLTEMRRLSDKLKIKLGIKS